MLAFEVPIIWLAASYCIVSNLGNQENEAIQLYVTPPGCGSDKS